MIGEEVASKGGKARGDDIVLRSEVSKKGNGGDSTKGRGCWSG